jgi:hypothetical protein
VDPDTIKVSQLLMYLHQRIALFWAILQQVVPISYGRYDIDTLSRNVGKELQLLDA